MANQSEKAQTIVRTWMEYKESPWRQAWLDRALTSEQFYFGNQWTAEEVKEMVARGFYPAIKNRITTRANQVISELSSQASSGRVIVTSGENSDGAHLINGIIKHSNYISHRGVQIRRVAQQMITKGGIGWLFLEIDPQSSDGEGDIYTEFVDNQYVYVAPTVTDFPSLRDAPGLIVAKPEPLEYAIRKHPDLKKRLEKEAAAYDWEKESVNYRNSDDDAVGTGSIDETSAREEFQSVLKIRDYKLVSRKRWKITDKRSGESWITYDKNLKAMEQVMLAFGLIEKVELPSVLRVKVTHLYAPNIWVAEEWMELDRIPGTPFIAQDTFNMFPLDMIWFAKDEQIVINKMRSLAINYIQSSLTPKIFLDKDMDEGDKKTFKENWSKSNAVMEIEFGPEGEKKYDVLMPAQIPSEFAREAESGENGIGQAFGVHNLTMGDPTGAPRTMGATQAMRQWDMQSRRHMLDFFNESLQEHDDKLVQLIPSVYNTERTLLYIDEDSIPHTLNLNKAEYVAGALQKISTHVVDDGVTHTVGAIADIRAQYRIIKDSFIPTDRAGLLQMFVDMLQFLPGSPTILKQIIRLSELPNRKDLLEEIDMIPQMEQKIQQSQQLIEQLVEMLKKSQSAEAQSAVRLIEASAKTKESIAVIKHNAKLDINEAEHELALEKIELEDEYQRKDQRLNLIHTIFRSKLTESQN